MITWLQKFESNRLFSSEEAWLLFRLAAIGEAVGWTLLLTGLACKRFVTPGNNLPVLLAGQVHGMLFLTYLTAAVGLYPSLRWKRLTALVAIAASVPPYGTLVFEQWAARQRRRAHLRRYGRFLIFTALPKSA